MINAQKLQQWILKGYQDHKKRTPWANAPVTCDEWLEGQDSPELEAYWMGWESGVMDAVAPVFRKHQAS